MRAVHHSPRTLAAHFVLKRDNTCDSNRQVADNLAASNVLASAAGNVALPLARSALSLCDARDHIQPRQLMRTYCSAVGGNSSMIPSFVLS
jgi:hypothetical protein